MNGLALCAGVGGLELGLSRAIPGYRTVGYVERDAYAAAVLVARMEDEALDRAPIWDDLTTFDGKPWRGVVDLVSAGFPCQPFSVAGKRKRLDDDRWIWPQIARIIGEVEPSFVFLENVPGVLSHGAGAVLDSLASLGFDAEWDLFSAADVGAPHRRMRWFCLAHAAGCGWNAQSLRRPSTRSGIGSLSADPSSEALAHAGCQCINGLQSIPRRECSNSSESWNASEALAYSNGGRELQPCGCESCERRRTSDGSGEVANPESREARTIGESHGNNGCSGTSGDALGDPAGTRLESGFQRASRKALPAAFPPGPHDQPAWDSWIRAGGPQPAVRRGADGVSDALEYRQNRLRCLGNAVVPDQAALAFRVLYERMMP